MARIEKLLTKTLRVFALYALLVLGASVPTYYYFIDGIWLMELDEHNELVAQKVKRALLDFDLEDEQLQQSIALWAKVQEGTNLTAMSAADLAPDSSYTLMKQNIYKDGNNIDRFRGLIKTIEVKGHYYRLEIETNVEETEETMLAISGITFIFFLILLLGFLVLSSILSVRLWRPFRATLAKLEIFNLNHHKEIDFDVSAVEEFEQLNAALSKLIAQNIAIYKTQKEFTENASHELQTPLAIIKSKLDLLLQEADLSEKQYKIIEELHKALARIGRINKNLLLLAKMEHEQFAEQESINISTLILNLVAQLRDYMLDKKLKISVDIADNILLKGNKTLIEIMFNNLLLNALRYTPENGEINISLRSKMFFISNTGETALESTALFQRFARVAKVQAGTGLGLYIIKEIAERHGWAISYSFERRHIFGLSFLS